MKKTALTTAKSSAHRVWIILCTVCLSVYIAYVGYFAHSGAFRSATSTAMAVAVFALLASGVGALLIYACGWLGGVAPKGRKMRDAIDLRVFAAALAIALGVFGIAFAACYPGGVNYDVSNQWRQVHSGEFNNWHPLLHTLWMWLVTRIWDNYSFVVLAQIGLFSGALAYLTAVLHKRGVPAWLALAAEAMVAMSPLVRGTLMTAGKDSAMTAGVLMLTAWTVETVFSRGEWLRKPRRAVMMGLVLAVTTLMRHNAMAWTYVLLVGLFWAFKACRRQTALAAIVMAAMLALIQGPLFASLNVVYPDNFVDESMGIPMTILGDIKQTQPDKLDGETTAFLATLASDEEWQNVYQLHNYNSIKFTFDREFVARKPLGEILQMTARACQAAPRTAFEAFNGLTDLVWGVTGNNEAVRPVRNSFDIPEVAFRSEKLNAMGAKLLSPIEWVMNLAPLRYLTQNIGVQLLLLLLVTLWALCRHDARVLVLTFPTLIYCLGTMMLLASNDARFFQFVLTICLPTMIALVFLPKEEE